MDQKSLLQSILPTLLLLMATVGGWIAKPVNFSSKRPDASVHAPADPGGLQTIETRLWKDPFSGLPPKEALHEEKHLKATLDRGRTLQRMLAEEAAARRPAAVLISLVHAGAGAFESESRLRQRHAVLAGLGVRGYVPENENHIGLFAVPWEEPILQKSPRLSEPFGDLDLIKTDYAAPLFCAFEFFEPANRQEGLAHSRILVLWLPETEFIDRPLARLAQLIAQIAPEQHALPFTLLGPKTTTGLFALCEEVETLDPASPVKLRRPGQPSETGFDFAKTIKGLRIYSPSATTTDELLPPLEKRGPGKDTPRGRKFLHERLGQLGVAFHDYSSNDQELTRLLAEELNLRGVDYSETDKILLLSEWHTDYGRALPLTFAANWSLPRTVDTNPLRRSDVAEELNANFGDNVRLIQKDPGGNFPGQLIKVGYLSGVDGDRKPETSSGSRGESQKEPAAGDLSAPDSSRYPAFGESQFDYMERLAAQLDREFGNPDSNRRRQERVIAIGVLGSDLYDKLHLVQALRPKFPQALFFTTDLDARMSAADTRPWMRNLLVASSWSLEPGASDQPKGDTAGRGRIPPFRDSYQTATYHAVKAALDKSDGASATPVPLGKVFEIGRTKPVEMERPGPLKYEDYAGVYWLVGLVVAGGLLVYFAQGKKTLLEGWYKRRVNPHKFKIIGALGAVAFAAEVVRQNITGVLWVCLGILVIGALFAFRKNDDDDAAPVHDDAKATHVAHPFDLTFGVFIVICVIGAAAWLVVPPKIFHAEPFHWLEGVSLWPAEMLRVMAGLLGIYWILSTHREVLAKGRHLMKTYHLDSREEVKPAGNEEPVRAREEWEKYRGKLDMGDSKWSEQSLHQATWVWVVSGVLMVFWLYFTYWQPDPLRPPYRGAFSWWVDLAVTLFVMIVYTVLLVQVFDISRKTRVFINILAQRPTAWPRPLIAEKLGLKTGETSGEQIKPAEADTPKPPGAPGVVETIGQHMDGWLDVRFVAELTHTIGNLVIRPFVILFLLLAATTHDFFDSWSMNQPYIITLSMVNAALPLLCGYFLCREADKARAIAAWRLKEAILNTDEPQAKGRYEQMLREVDTCRTGAFRPIYEQPYIVALLIPLGGSGGIEILKRLLTS